MISLLTLNIFTLLINFSNTNLVKLFKDDQILKHLSIIVALKTKLSYTV
jgi:hypothetical protein